MAASCEIGVVDSRPQDHFAYITSTWMAKKAARKGTRTSMRDYTVVSIVSLGNASSP